MGEARRRRLAQEGATGVGTIEQIDARVDFARISSAIRKLSVAASAHFGQDCYVHASLCQALLATLGVESRVVVGFAAWRVGSGDGDVICHAPLPGMVAQDGALPFHAWLEIGDPISPHRILLDLTTYQLRRKAAELDELAGGHTVVQWCPDYLAVRASEVSPMGKVTQETAGLFYYEHHAATERLIMQKAGPVDEYDLNALLTIYRNPDVVVFGPNDEK